MAIRHAAVARRRAVRHARRLHDRSALRAIALAVVAVVTFGVAGASATWARMQGNIATVNIDDLVRQDDGPSAPTPSTPVDPSAGQAINILLLGSDQRDGENGEIGGANVAGMRSDTTIVAHVSADRTRVDLVSIPRDSLVDIPSCQTTNGTWTGARTEAMFNEAFAIGWDNGGDLASAAACTWRTVEANTGVTLTDYVVVDFAGFQRMVDALDGVPICIPYDIRSKKAQLDLQAGNHVLDGRTALGFARARTGTGLNGSDINRIGNQQRLLSAMVNTVLSRDVLTDPRKVLSFLDAVTSSLTTDITLANAAGLAYGLRAIHPANVTFMTIPWKSAPQDKDRVVWSDAAQGIWQRIAADQPIDERAASATTPAATPGASQPPAQPAPAQTRKAGVESFTAADTTAVCG